MEIVVLPKDRYQGHKLDFEYTSLFYYDVVVKAGVFDIALELKRFGAPLTKRFSGELFEDHFEDAEAYGLVSDRHLAAYLEVNFEKWSNRLRITNLLVEKPYRGRNYATFLLDKAKAIAKQRGAREVILETQSCNYPAIQTYLKNSFRINGIDLSCYSNHDVVSGEVRLEMHWREAFAAGREGRLGAAAAVAPE